MAKKNKIKIIPLDKARPPSRHQNRHGGFGTDAVSNDIVGKKNFFGIIGIDNSQRPDGRLSENIVDDLHIRRFHQRYSRH